MASAVLTAGITAAQAAPHAPEAVEVAQVPAKDQAKVKHAIDLFRHAGQSAWFFDHCYGFAIIPTVGEGAFVVGGAGGKGYVFAHGRLTGETTLAQVSVGFQAGGEAYSEIIFFENKAAADEFMSGGFEFGADAKVTAITASAGASAATNGEEAGASGGEKDARTVGHYYKGMAVFTITKGGLMYQAAISGQKFTFHPLASS